MKSPYQTAICSLVALAMGYAGNCYIQKEKEKAEAMAQIENLKRQNDSIELVAGSEIHGLHIDLSVFLSGFHKRTGEAKARTSALIDEYMHRLDSIREDKESKIASNNARIEQLAKMHKINLSR